MADGTLILADDAANLGKKIDTTSLTVGANTVHRERYQIAGLLAAQIAAVLNADPVRADYALAVRAIGIQSVLWRSSSLVNVGQIVSNVPCSIRSLWAINIGTAGLLNYVKLYNKAGVPVAGDNALLKAVIPLQPGTPTPVVLHDSGFNAGLSVRGTQIIDDTDDTTPGANAIVILIETGP